MPDGSTGKNPPANAGDAGSIPGSGRSPGEGNGNPPQCFFLENPTDRGAWSPWGHKRVGHEWVTKQQWIDKVYKWLGKLFKVLLGRVA